MAEGEMYLGSDAIALAPLTDMINYLEEGDVSVITRQGIEFFDAKGECVRRPAKIAGAAMVNHPGLGHEIATVNRRGLPP